ncbi:MAG: cation-translocating P-type ATPase [Firmicutes bacterium]|nr:cation-translocating P-type ATPase [Bacillota bacterium]
MRASRWYAMSAADAVRAMGTDPLQGLAPDEARRRLLRHGPNLLAGGREVSLVALFVKQFQDLMVMVLMGAAVVSGLLGELWDAAAIAAIVLLNGALGFVQEYRAERSLAALKELTAPKARVLRAGNEEVIPAAELVPGDVMLLFDGDRVPADGRILDEHALEVDESPLTGESVPVAKDALAVHPAETGLGDRTNMVYMGTAVTRGRARCLVTATGMDTEIGRIAGMIQEAEPEPTPLQRRLNHLGRWLVTGCLVIVAVVFAAGVWRGFPVYRMFLTAVSLAVAAIPEGLPAVVTIALALGVQRMLRRNCIVRHLPAVETLGCATVICSDKTGTLTRNEMTVTRLWFPGREVEVTGEGYAPRGRFLEAGRPVDPRQDPDLSLALRIGAGCNHARVQQGPRGFTVLGDPTEAALLVAAAKAGIAPGSPGPVVAELPFDSIRKRMSVLVRDRSGLMLLCKGAPDVVVPRCTRIRRAGRIESLRNDERLRILREADRMAGQALRVLALAYADRLPGPPPRELDDKWEEGLVFAGLVGMMDPPREEAREALRIAEGAGIRTIIVTGDHRATAAAVARQLGLIGRNDEVATGADLDRWSDEELSERLRRAHVFARVSPAHKLRIVRALRSQGHVVAMTGDGVNDAPAIREADIGVAMGRTGTDVTRDTADMILTDDNYATIVAAVEEGRGIYENIRRLIRYLLGCNAGEVLTMLAAALAAMPMPLLPLQILWTNLVTDGLPAISFGLIRPDPGTMKRRPRSPREGLFSQGLGLQIAFRGVLIAACTLAVFAIALFHLDAGEDRARTLAFTTLVAAQLVYAFQCQADSRSPWRVGVRRNPHLTAAVALSLAMQLVVLYWPPLQRVFGTVPPSSRDWLLVAFFSGWYVVLEWVLVAAWQAIVRRLAALRV